jgi:FkbM family methyltransferase
MKQLLKTIYKALPFKKQVFTFIRPFHPPERIYQHLYFTGAFKVKVDNSYFKIRHSGYQVENDLFWTGLDNWERVSLDLWKRLSKSSNTIIDIGANTGVYSLISGAVNPSASIYAFEPLVYKKLEDNVNLNTFNIKPCNIAISNSNGQAKFFTDSTDFSYTASLNKDHQAQSNKLSIAVETKTLDRFCDEKSLFPDLVKIDVERHEPEVIEGFMNTIKKHYPTMLIEVLDSSIGDRLKELLKDTSYQYYSISETKGTCRRMAVMGKSEEFNVLVCTESIAVSLGLLRSV